MKIKLPSILILLFFSSFSFGQSNYSATPTGSSAVNGIGLFYLFPSYKAEPPPDPSTALGLSNPCIQGMLWRETWDRIDKNGQGNHDWAYLDSAFSASDAHQKLSSLQVLAGGFAPSWFYNLPGVQVLNLSGFGPTSVPWDSVFQQKWEEVQSAMAARYDGNPNLKYVVMSGVGHASESFLVKTAADSVAADSLAKLAGYPDAITAWTVSVKQMIDMYAKHWINTPFVLCTGPAFPTGGDTALQAVYNYGSATYPGRFGARADDLSSGGPQPFQPSATIIQAISPNCSATGYQFANHQNVNDPNPPARLDTALKRGISYGAHFIELFADDADDPVSAQVLCNAAAVITGTSTVMTEIFSITISPNPFSSSSTVNIDLPERPHHGLTFEVYDIYGKKIQSIALTSMKAASLRFTLKREHMAAGLYFCKLIDNEKILSAGKVIVQ